MTTALVLMLLAAMVYLCWCMARLCWQFWQATGPGIDRWLRRRDKEWRE